ncbi:hypothetical protein B0H13DRAFT_1207082 [Mycena leptocephala]|nr:hypothetical protein B0H13DRAFT_1207082 [Mycena leptocephala]
MLPCRGDHRLPSNAPHHFCDDTGGPRSAAHDPTVSFSPAHRPDSIIVLTRPHSVPNSAAGADGARSRIVDADFPVRSSNVIALAVCHGRRHARASYCVPRYCRHTSPASRTSQLDPRDCWIDGARIPGLTPVTSRGSTCSSTSPPHHPGSCSCSQTRRTSMLGVLSARLRRRPTIPVAPPPVSPASPSALIASAGHLRQYKLATASHRTRCPPACPPSAHAVLPPYPGPCAPQYGPHPHSIPRARFAFAFISLAIPPHPLRPICGTAGENATASRTPARDTSRVRAPTAFRSARVWEQRPCSLALA